jgi:two-component system chemotaxis response regulator CheY
MAERHALIIEDSPTMRQLISFSLRRIADLELIEAENGAQALEILRERQVDLILLDLRMPVMGGFSFLERFAELQLAKKPPVVVITTEGDQESVERAKEYGVNAYITKPVQSTDMALIIEELLNKPAQ